LLYPGSRAARGIITVSGVPNRLNYCGTFTVFTGCENVAGPQYNLAARGVETHGFDADFGSHIMQKYDHLTRHFFHFLNNAFTSVLVLLWRFSQCFGF
jgi:hypothetical protein